MKITNTIKIITQYLVVVGFLFISGCIKNNIDYSYKDNIAVSIDISAAMANSIVGVDPLTAAEDKISSIRIYAFNSKDELESVVYSDEKDITESSIMIQLRVAGVKTFYAIINGPTVEALSLEAITDLADLNNIEYTLANYFTGGSIFSASNVSDYNFTLPMTGSQIATITVDGQQITLEVTRCVARVDIMMKKESTFDVVKIDEITNFAVKNIIPKGRLFSESNIVDVVEYDNPSVFGPTAALSIPQGTATGVAESVRAFWFYTPARAYTDTDKRMTFTLTGIKRNDKLIGIDGEIPLFDTSINEVLRNYKYKVSCSVSDIGELTFEQGVTISAWGEKLVDTDVGGSITVLNISTPVVGADEISSSITIEGSHAIELKLEGSNNFVATTTATNKSLYGRPAWLKTATYTHGSTADGSHIGTFNFTKVRGFDVTPQTPQTPGDYKIAIKCGDKTITMVVAYGEALEGVSVKINGDWGDWDDSNIDIDGNIGNGLIEIDIPSNVVVPATGIREVPYSANSDVSVSVKIGADWFDIADINVGEQIEITNRPDWLSKFKWVKSVSGSSFVFQADPLFTGIADVFLIKLVSGGVSKIVTVTQEK